MQPSLRGRRREGKALDDLLLSVRTGESRVLVVRGEAGIGKTALLERLAGSASEFQVHRAAGVESEMELAHAGLHQLCAPFADRIESLPGPQRDALNTAFGRRDGDAPNRFLVGLAVLGLLSDVAEQKPLLWIIDDAQWLDEASSQTLAFVARRLGAESVAMVVGIRDGARKDDFVGLDELVVRGLGERDSRSLLDTVLTGPLDDRVRERLISESRGNPLALLELPRGLTPAEVAGGFGIPYASSLESRIEESFRRRLAPLPPATRVLLLIASAEPIGDPGPVWRAAGTLGVGPAARHPAAELTPEPKRRARRALAAAQSKQRAGAPDAALQLLAFAETGRLGELDQTRAQLLRAQITFTVTRGGDAPQLLLEAAKRLEPLDGSLARETYLDAFAAALFADRLARGSGLHDIAEAVLAADWGESSRRSPRACDLLLEGIAVVTIDGYAAGAPTLKSALRAFQDEPMSDEEALRWLWLACRAARALGDEARMDELTARQVRLAREAGDLSMLPIALAERFSVQLFIGDLMAAEGLVAEAEAVAEATGSRLAPQSALLAGLRGDEAKAIALIEAARREVVQRGEGLWLLHTEWASAVLFNSLGRYDEAFTAAEKAVAHPHELGVSTWVQPEFIEAAVRSGRAEHAAGPMRRLREISSAAGTNWALGVEARSRALLSDGDVAEGLYREAIALLSRTRVRTAHARAHLVYGEWLRRERRRVDARKHLRIAHDMYVEIGMKGFAERARRERLATGETVRKRSPETRDNLTAQEAQIARLVIDGCTNPEVGAQLFISPRTVEWHLRNVFTKLGIRSRRELHDALPGAAPPRVPA